MHERELLTVDEHKLRERAQEAADELIERAGLEFLTTRGFDPWASEYRLDHSPQS